MLTKKLLARWSSKRGKHWIALYAELGPKGASLLPGFSYEGDGCGGFIGTVAPEVAMQHAARQASYNPSNCPRVFYDEAVAAECCALWRQEARS